MNKEWTGKEKYLYKLQKEKEEQIKIWKAKQIAKENRKQEKQKEKEKYILNIPKNIKGLANIENKESSNN